MARRGALSIADLDYAANDEPWLPRQFWRYAAWGSAACVAFALAMVALASEQGSQRIAAAWRPPPAEAADTVSTLLAGRIGNTELEARRLNELVRTLTADRDRLMTRIASLERNFDEMSGTLTASVTSGSPSRSAFVTPAATPAAEPATPAPVLPPTAGIKPTFTFPPPPTLMPPQTTAVTGSAPTTRITDGHAASVPEPAEPTSRITEFGIDVGADSSLDNLRKRWSTLRGSHAALLEGLRPLVGVRDGQKTIELRLILGPLASPGVAARYCTALSVSGVVCQPTPYEGQKLASR